MTVNFPSTDGKPTDGSFKYVYNGIVYSWDGQKWTGEVTDNGDSERVGTLQEVTNLGNTTTNNILVGGAQSGAMPATGARMRASGDISIRKDGGTASVFEVFKDTTDAPTCSINNDGNITAGGGKAIITSDGDFLTHYAGSFGFGVNNIGCTLNYLDSSWTQGTFEINERDSDFNKYTRLSIVGNGSTSEATFDGKITASGTLRVGGEPWSFEKGTALAVGTVQSTNNTGSAVWLGGEVGGSHTTTITAEGDITAAGTAIFGSDTLYNLAPDTNVQVTGDSTNAKLTLNSPGNTTYSLATRLQDGPAGSGASYFVIRDESQASDVFYIDQNSNAYFEGNVTASNISNFKTNLKTAITSATDLASVKTAILDALEQL